MMQSVTLDLFDTFNNLCPICLTGSPIKVDVTDFRSFTNYSVYALACNTCNFVTPGHVNADGYEKILQFRWDDKNKILIDSKRYDLGISIIKDKISAYRTNPLRII